MYPMQVFHWEVKRKASESYTRVGPRRLATHTALCLSDNSYIPEAARDDKKKGEFGSAFETLASSSNSPRSDLI